jgi:hypothetical protein
MIFILSSACSHYSDLAVASRSTGLIATKRIIGEAKREFHINVPLTNFLTRVLTPSILIFDVLVSSYLLIDVKAPIPLTTPSLVTGMRYFFSSDELEFQ